MLDKRYEPPLCRSRSFRSIVEQHLLLRWSHLTIGYSSLATRSRFGSTKPIYMTTYGGFTWHHQATRACFGHAVRRFRLRGDTERLNHALEFRELRRRLAVTCQKLSLPWWSLTMLNYKFFVGAAR